jgi:flagellar P-ring protein precursor FlgI
MRRFQAYLSLICVLFMPLVAQADRVKDMASIQGVRENQLMGYGLVVGLDGSGDMTTQTPFTVQTIMNMLMQMGVNINPSVVSNMQLTNVAAVTVTASLPAYARPGQNIDVTVSSIGNAKSLRGGTLLMTPLKGADGQVYAMAQGNLLVSGVGVSSAGSKLMVNHMSVGLIPSGATVERLVPSSVGQGDFVTVELNSTDFGTAARMANEIDRQLAGSSQIATTLDGRTIQVRAPQGSARVAFLAQLENVQVDRSPAVAKVIINARTGSVVMNQLVTLDDCSVAHGNLTVVVNTENAVSQPNAFSAGQTARVSQSSVDIKAAKGELMLLRHGASLNEVVKALNSIGATPQDLLSILQAMKTAGALHAELEII